MAKKKTFWKAFGYAYYDPETDLIFESDFEIVIGDEATGGMIARYPATLRDMPADDRPIDEYLMIIPPQSHWIKLGRL